LSRSVLFPHCVRALLAPSIRLPQLERSQMKRLAKWPSIVIGSSIVVFSIWFWFLPNDNNPRTLDQAVKRLLTDVPEVDLARLKATPPGDLVEFHFSLGMYIRNEYGLWDGNLRLLLSIGKREALHPDFASHFVIVALWEHLNSTAANKSAMDKPDPASSRLTSVI
jgi:hypothetical protein